MAHKKCNLPHKICPICHRLFMWRKNGIAIGRMLFTAVNVVKSTKLTTGKCECLLKFSLLMCLKKKHLPNL